MASHNLSGPGGMSDLVVTMCAQTWQELFMCDHLNRFRSIVDALEVLNCSLKWLLKEYTVSIEA